MRVPVNGNKFFNKHIAIVGSTGSGKSHTLTTILQKAVEGKNGDFSLNAIRELSSASTESPTLLGLYHAAHQLGYDAEGLQAGQAYRRRRTLSSTHSWEKPPMNSRLR